MTHVQTVLLLYGAVCVGATLGYAGSYSLTIPNGTAATALTQAQQAVTSDALKVSNDTSAPRSSGRHHCPATNRDPAGSVSE